MGIIQPMGSILFFLNGKLIYSTCINNKSKLNTYLSQFLYRLLLFTVEYFMVFSNVGFCILQITLRKFFHFYEKKFKKTIKLDKKSIIFWREHNLWMPKKNVIIFFCSWLFFSHILDSKFSKTSKKTKKKISFFCKKILLLIH